MLNVDIEIKTLTFPIVEYEDDIYRDYTKIKDDHNFS